MEQGKSQEDHAESRDIGTMAIPTVHSNAAWDPNAAYQHAKFGQPLWDPYDWGFYSYDLSTTCDSRSKLRFNPTGAQSYSYSPRSFFPVRDSTLTAGNVKWIKRPYFGRRTQPVKVNAPSNRVPIAWISGRVGHHSGPLHSNNAGTKASDGHHGRTVDLNRQKLDASTMEPARYNRAPNQSSSPPVDKICHGINLDVKDNGRESSSDRTKSVESSESDEQSSDQGSLDSDDHDGEDSECPSIVNVDVTPDSDNSELSYTSVDAACETSASTREWRDLLTRDEPDLKQAAIQEIMMIFGHEEVKSHCLSLFRKFQRKRDHPKTRVVFGGNNGLGVARLANLYARLLQRLGSGDLLQEKAHSTSDVKLILESKGDQIGACIIQIHEFSLSAEDPATMHTLFEELPERVSVVAYKTWASVEEASAFKDVFFEAQPVLFPKVFLLQDYTQKELQDVMTAAAQKSNIQFEGGFNSADSLKAAELMSYGSGKPGFQNDIMVHRGLKVMAETQKRRCQRRSSGMDLRRVNSSPVILAKADMLGETANQLKERIPAWHKLNAMVGLDQVKKTIGLYFSQVQYQHCRALQGQQQLKTILNRLFLGPPGTGKTTTAMLLVDILFDLGLIKKRNIVAEQPTTLIGSYVGHSEKAIRKAFNKARGGVLIIDDAHTFFSGGKFDDQKSSSDSFRRAMIDTLISQYQQQDAHSPEKRVTVFFIGHKESVVELLETSNAGLGEIFRLDEALQFPTYSENHLRDILQQGLVTAGLVASPGALKTAHEFLSLAKHRPNFGNATAVMSLLSTAISRYRARVLETMDLHKALAEPLQPEDFDPDYDRPRLASERAIKLFSRLDGMEYIQTLFRGYQDLVVQLRAQNLDPRPYVPLSFVFRGPPGTGKTTVARKVAQMYYDMGFLSAPDMIECSVTQLVSPSRDNSNGVEVMFERALGKVLFIDEAYLLLYIGSDGAIGALVDCMTKSRFFGKLVVVLAGYSEDMDKLLAGNRGLRSRFATNISFRPMKPTNVLSLLQKLVNDAGLHITGLRPGDDSRPQAVRLLTRLTATRSWANGREVEGLARTLIQNTYTTLRTKGQNYTSGGIQKTPLEVEAKDVIILLASRLGKALEAEEKKDAPGEDAHSQESRTHSKPAAL